MATIVTAQGYDINSDKHPRVLCTPEFARSQGYSIIEGSEREVPDADIDDNGVYHPAKP